MKYKKNRKKLIITACIIFCIALFFCVFIYLSKNKDRTNTNEANSNNVNTSDNSTNNDENKENSNDIINNNTDTENNNSQSSENTQNSNSSIEINNDQNSGDISSTGNDNRNNSDSSSNKDNNENMEINDSYDFTKPVPESDSVEDDYFSDTVFIGNSQIEGISIYSSMKDATVYAGKGIMVNTIYKQKIIRTKDSEKITIMDALSKKQFKKVYILLGANELGWAYDSVFIKDYEKVIGDIKSLQPDAIIYVSSILPVSETKDNNDNIYNNSNIKKFNKLIADMCSSNEIYYLDSNSALVDENGYLPEDAGPDGVHLNRDYYTKWFDYIKKHTIKDEKN